MNGEDCDKLKYALSLFGTSRMKSLQDVVPGLPDLQRKDIDPDL